MVMQLSINIDVDDLDRAVAFYRDALGLVAGRRLFDGSVVEMLGGTSKIYLLQKPAYASASAYAHLPRSYHGAGRLCSWISKWTVSIARSPLAQRWNFRRNRSDGDSSPR